MVGLIRIRRTLSWMCLSAYLMVGFAELHAQKTAHKTGRRSAPEILAPSARGGYLLPSGYLSTLGSQIVDARGTPVRIASIGWDGTDGPAGAALEGLWAVNYKLILRAIKEDGFNAVRIPWSDVNLDVPFTGLKKLNSVDWSKNSELKGLTTLEVFKKLAVYSKEVGLKIIFDHHTNDGDGGQQPNGLWIDKGPGTDGTDGVPGKVGTIDAARFQADWVHLAKTFAGNSTVIGFDLDNEPHGALWGGGGPTDIRKMFMDVGNAIHAVNPDVLIICEPSEDYTSPTNEGNVSVANIGSKPVVLTIPNKVVYSVHEYPNEVTELKLDAGPEFVRHMNYAWGDVVRQHIAPVWIGEMGSDMKSDNSRAWASTLLDYMNGKDGALGGPTFTGNEQPVSGSWWKIGVEGHGGNPDGNQTAWGLDSYKHTQQVITDQMLFKPRHGKP